jgi:phosphopantetheinyl transferase
LRIWTLKEALLKASGHGFSRPPNDFEIALEPLALSYPAVHAMGADQWHIEQRKLSARHWASIAVRHPPDTTILVRWRSVTALEIAAGLSHKSE